MFGNKKSVDTSEKAIKLLLSRGVEDVFVRESLEAKLKSGKSLRVKLGFDPTGPRIHIGRAIILRKLREFQKLGHTAVFVIGDFTAKIGDPSDKLEKRPMLTDEAIKENLKEYKNQVGKILDISKAEFHYNSKWLSRLTFKEISELAESFSVSQMTARRNFKDRLERGDEVSLREFLYPLMQGYDSIAVKADVEIGGFDQLFNLKAGRVIQKHYGMPEQDILTTSMLEGLDGRKMSTSWGNVINITDDPDDMFGKAMSLKDELIEKYCTLCTDMEDSDISAMTEGLKGGKNPRDAKLDFAQRLVSLYHGKDAADKARGDFDKIFSKAEFPSDAQEISLKKGELLSEALKEFVSSKSDFSRLVSEGAIFEFKSGKKIIDRKTVVVQDMDLRIGKHRFVRIKVS